MVMSLQDDMDSKANWTQSDIDALKSKYSRTHFTHFAPLPRKLKRAPRKVVNGVTYIRMFGKWQKLQR
jgi:hypothetical protein